MLHPSPSPTKEQVDSIAKKNRQINKTLSVLSRPCMSFVCTVRLQRQLVELSGCNQLGTSGQSAAHTDKHARFLHRSRYSVSTVFVFAIGLWIYSTFLWIYCVLGEAIKCFDCNSANNSACLDIHLHKMKEVIPIVDCAKSLPHFISKQFFCRKMTQTLLHPDKTPEVRVYRSCGWVKHKRECYTNDNKDHLETVCQCFGDMCNAAATLQVNKMTTLIVSAAILYLLHSWREKV
ncbi:uncharacterized protein LOC131848931 [Achroia grisella]|uniref:uncharacterized protein LOC131848931 n=1 Tax=Achroia grisella TaxID=688607 RepID=UPI0027D2E9C3|nr:uncharacterized protein LOC131848931 [Achroia grisella]